MTYDEAVKEIAAKKSTKDNFLVVKLAYELTLVMPYKDGLALLESLKNVEQFDKDYQPTRIQELKRGNLEVTVMSYAEYERFKVAGLLNITVEEAKQLQTPPPQPENRE